MKNKGIADQVFSRRRPRSTYVIVFGLLAIVKLAEIIALVLAVLFALSCMLSLVTGTNPNAIGPLHIALAAGGALVMRVLAIVVEEWFKSRENNGRTDSRARST